MQAAHMTYEEETLRLRSETKRLRIENTNLKKRVELLTNKMQLLEQENQGLRRENRHLKQRQQLLIEKQQALEKKLESQGLIIEELRRMVFGKRKVGKESETDKGSGTPEDTEQIGNRKGTNRDASSYRRAKPKEEEVTDTFDHVLFHCPECGSMLVKLKAIIRYIEDIADVTQIQQHLRRVEKHIIGSGYCQNCKKRKTAKAITPQMSILGENVKKFIAYLVVIMRLSFSQVGQFLSDTAALQVSEGEIVASLDEQAGKLDGENTRLLSKIRGAPARHYDETGWKVQSGGEGNYCWVSRSTEGVETIFLMGKSRGKGNAEKLRGGIDNQVGISDDYAAYDNLFAKHQLCMAHPKRKLRDLAETKTITGIRKTACISSYEAFSKLYKNLEETLASEYNKDLWLQKRDTYLSRLKEIAVTTENDPQKLKTIKQSLTQNAEKYFTCLLQPGIPADNNKAERGLRHIVLKRKISYGSKSQKGANTMSVLFSTMLSCWWNKPNNFFTAYNQMLTN